jgi:hypothetical protein
VIPKLSLYGIIALGSLLIATGGYAFVQSERREAAEARAEEQRKRAETAEAVAEGRRNAIEQLQVEMRAAQERARFYQNVRRSVSDVANTNACADSPAIRAALDGLFRPPGRPAGNSRGLDSPSR